jgi:hypothetical protein
MGRIGSYQETANGTKPLPVPLPKLPKDEKHLDAALLALVRDRKLELGVMPGVPFN